MKKEQCPSVQCICSLKSLTDSWHSKVHCHSRFILVNCCKKIKNHFSLHNIWQHATTKGTHLETKSWVSAEIHLHLQTFIHEASCIELQFFTQEAQTRACWVFPPPQIWLTSSTLTAPYLSGRDTLGRHVGMWDSRLSRVYIKLKQWLMISAC